MPAKRSGSKKSSGGRARSSSSRNNAGSGGRGGRARQSDRGQQVPVRFETMGEPVTIMRPNSETNFLEISRKQVVEEESGDIQREFISISAGWFRRDDDENITEERGYNKGGITFPPDQCGEVMDAMWSQLDEEEQEEQEPTE